MAKMALEADSNIVGESFIIQPDKNAAAKLGVLFGVIEVYNINDTFLDGFLSAIKDLKTEYYLPPFNLEKGVEKRFEEAISRANRRIFAAINSSIEEIDLRNVSAAIGLYHDNKVYLSSAGRMKGLFFRRKKNLELLIIDILSGNGEARFRPEPEKLFANILSGELQKRDAVLLINEEFLRVFSQKELGETALDNTAAEAIKSLTELLQEKVAKNNFYSIVIAPDKQMETDLPFAAKAESALSADVSTKPFRDSGGIKNIINPIRGKIAADAMPLSPSRKAMPAGNALHSDAGRHNVAGGPTQQSIDRLLITQVRTEKFLTPSLLPQWQKILLVILNAIKKTFAFSFRQTKKLFSAGLTKVAALKNRERIASDNHEEKTSGIEHPTEQDIASMPPEDKESDEKESDPPELLMEEIAIAPRRLPGGLTAKINNFINNQIEKFLALKKGQQIVLILGLVLIFLFSQSIVMIGRASDKGQNSTSANSIIAKQIEDQLNGAEAQNIFNDEPGALLAIKKARELLAQIPDTRLNKAYKSDLLSKIDSAAKTLQKISYLDNPVVAADFSTNQAAVQLIGLAKTGTIFWGFDNLSRTLYRLDPATNKITQATTTLPLSNKMSAIDDKNLVLLAQDKSYYKYDIAKRAASKIKPGKDYFQIKIPPTASPFIDPSLASSTIVMSIADVYSFYLDGVNGRVVALDKNGVLKRQYYSDKFKGAASLATDAKNKKLWVFNGGKVYQIDMDF